MTTGRYLWLGFGTLIVLLLATCLLIVAQVASVDGEVREMADARNFSAAAAQLESDTLRYVLNVREYLQTRDPGRQAEADAASSAVEHHLREYRRLAVNDGRYGLAESFEPLWRELRTQGQALSAPESAAPNLEHLQRFVALRTRLEHVLSRDLQASALAAYNRRKDEALADIRTVIHFALFLLLGGVALALGTSTAISRGIVRAETRLAASRELLRVTLESIADAVVTTDRAGFVTYLNPTAEALTGWTRHDATGKSLSDVLRLVEENSRAPLESSAALVLKDKTAIDARIQPILLSRQDGECAVEERASAIRDDSGTIVGAVMIVRDVTARRGLERELRRQTQAMTDADRHKTEFLSMLSHELRNPLAPISNGLQVLRLRIAEVPSLQPVVAMMERQVTQMVRLVDDLIDIGRVSRGRIELRKKPTDLVKALQLAVEGTRPLLEGNDQDLQVSLPSTPLTVVADPTRLVQIVGNLLNNAAKFTPPRGTISLSASIDDEWVAISVADTGIGISAQNLPYVFDLYMQADDSLGRSGSGIGLGLALVKALIDLHGGTVKARSAGLGKGSEFTIRLPVTAPHADPAPDAVEVASPPSRRHRVLVVDDDRDVAASMAVVLETRGHEVRLATDGAQALSIAQDWQPEAVLLDLGMPGLDGYQVARLVRASSWGRALRLVALSGFGQAEDRRRTHAAGFDAHLVKPASIMDVESAIAPSTVA